MSDSESVGVTPRSGVEELSGARIPTAATESGSATVTEAIGGEAPFAGRSRPIRRDAFFRRSLAVADVVAALGCLTVIGALSRDGVELAAVLAAVVIVPVAKLMGRYDRDELVLRKSTLEEFPALLALAAAFALSWSLLDALAGHPHRSSAGAVWAVMAALLTVARASARSLARSTGPGERVLIVGGSRPRQRLAHSLATDPGARIEVVGFLPLEDERLRDGPLPPHRTEDTRRRARTFSDLSGTVDELCVDRVFLALSNADSETTLDAVSAANAVGVKVSIVPSLLEVVGSAVEFDTVGGVTVLGLRQPGLSRSSRAIKRGMDCVGAGIGLIVMSPVFALAALAIKLDSPGPVFFRQPRVGRDGRVFRMVKFRSMVDGAEAQRAALESLNETDGVFKLSADPRVTRIGGFLRSASIDEVPQLLNVLRGDMSLVGPRPLVLDEDRLIEGRHRSRLRLAPGMTGPWQVLGPLRPPLSEMVKTDYLYAANWSLWSDVKIVLRTFAHVANRRGL